MEKKTETAVEVVETVPVAVAKSNVGRYIKYTAIGVVVVGAVVAGVWYFGRGGRVPVIPVAPVM